MGQEKPHGVAYNLREKFTTRDKDYNKLTTFYTLLQIHT
jgi:hypothetical protein